MKNQNKAKKKNKWEGKSAKVKKQIIKLKYTLEAQKQNQQWGKRDW